MLDIPLVLEWIPAGMHSPEDISWIEQANEAQPLIEKMSVLELEHGLRTGKFQLFRLKPGPGCLVTEIRSANEVKRLCLIRGAGRAAWQMRALFELLRETAKEWGCECIETVVYSHRLKRALELCGAETEGTIMTYSVERPDGQ